MIKLITQFDNEKTKLSLATPTCGCCCCCCCCCIVSTFATASISARNFGDYVEKELPNEPKKIKSARRIGFFFPIGLLICLVIGLWLAAEFEFNVIISLLAIGVLYLFIVSSLFEKKIDLPEITSKVIKYSVLLVVLEMVELFGGFVAIIYLGGVYLVVAVIISILLICWAFGKNYDDIEDNNNSNTSIKNFSNNQLNENINDVEKIDNTNILTNELKNKEIPKEKKKCPKCGMENVIDNKRCIYCSNSFEKDDKK